MDSEEQSSSERSKIKRKDADVKKYTRRSELSKSSKKCKSAMLDDGPWKRTIKATISDIKQDRDSYILYLEDEDIGLQEFEEESVLLDGLHKKLYVTFKDEETARKAIEMEHEPFDSNIVKVEMATPADFDTYPNLLFLYGFDIQSAEDSASLKDMITEITELEVIDVEYHDEPKAAVITFDEKTCNDITPLTWSLTNINGMKMITAPVYKKNSLLVSGLNETIPHAQLKRYMTNKKRSGGGPLQNLQYLSEEEAVLTFENEDDFNDVLQWKDKHKIGHVGLDISPIYECLIKSYLDQLCLDVSPKSLMKVASQIVEPSIRKPSKVQHDQKAIETLALSESLELNEEELTLLEKSDFLTNLKKRNKTIKIDFEHEKKAMIIQGNVKSDIQDFILEILKICRNEITSIHITTLTPEQQQFIRNENVLLKMNSLLPNAYLKCYDNSFKIFHMKSEDSKVLTDIVESQISMTKKPLNSDKISILQSTKGLTFLSDLIAASDDTKVCPLMKVDTKNEFLLMLGPKDTMYSLEKEVDRFLELNQVIIKEIPFSKGKQSYVRRYLHEELIEIKQNIGEDVELDITSDKYIVKGLKDPVEECHGKLTCLSGKIKHDKIKLNYYGIQEFLLQDHDGKSKIKEIEEKNKCVITEASENDISDTDFEQATVSQSLVLRAKANIDGAVTVNFMLGNILDLKVDVLVNPLDSTLKLRSGLSKAILKEGGNRILSDLKSSMAFKGMVQETASGNLSNIKSILHIKCPTSENSDIKELRVVIKSCLELAAQQGYRSIAFPAVGIDKFLKFPLLPACKCLVREVIDYAESGRTSLTNIYFCDNKDDVVNELMDRFEAISTNSNLEKYKKENKKDTLVAQRPKQISKSHTGKNKNVQGISVKVLQGEINKQVTDVIVITADKSLDLTKGKISHMILKEAGDQIQDELNNLYKNGIKPGDFAKTSGGQLFCQNIFYACLSRYRQGSESYLGRLVEKILQEADQLKMKSISIPALGTGKLEYPSDVSAKVIAEVINRFTESHPKISLRIIKIVVFPSDLDVFHSFSSFFPINDKRRQNDYDDCSSDNDNEGASYHTNSHYTKKTPQAKDSLITFGRVTLNIIHGDILKEQRCDVIVNGIKDNMDLSKSGQVCKALLGVCGSELQDECTQKKETMKEEGVVVTSAPNLACKYIIHVSQDKFAKCWKDGITKVLNVAENMDVSSLALPALGTGSRHADVKRIKNLILDAIENFGKKKRTSLTSIRLVVYDQKVFDAFMEQPTGRENSSVQEDESDLSSEVVLTIYSENIKNVKDAAWDIESFCKKLYKNINENNDPTAKKLNTNQVKVLEKLGVQHRVKVTIKIDKGVVIMQSFNSDGIYQVQRMMQQLVVEALEKHHNTIQRTLPSAIVWQIKRGSKWIKYEPLLNSDLEQQYLVKARRHEITDANGDKYEIDFIKMKANLLDYDDEETFDIQRVDLTKEGEPLPKEWTPMRDNENFMEIDLKVGSPEYKQVEQQVINTNGNIQIKKILRLQNKTLYQQYAVKKRDLENHNPKGHQNELQLFHGTGYTAVPQINVNGFNRSYCGVNGTMYGKGVYFHRHSSYSVGYANPPDAQNNHYLYLARVLVGESTPANAQMVFLPSKPKSNRPFDSAVSGDIYVIFYDTQAYPEYLIIF